MDVRMIEREVVALDLKTHSDFTFTQEALAAFFVALAKQEEMWGDDPITRSPITVTHADIIHCAQGSNMVNIANSGRLRIEGSAAKGTYIGLVAGLGEIAGNDMGLRRELLRNFRYLEKVV